jgi:pyruvate formate lyase activating enzyme
MDRLTKRGSLFESLGQGAVRCYACAHRCLIQPGKRGICRVRFNREGELRVPWGYVSALNVDPIEKKPFHHFLPGSAVLTFGMLGCNFHCEFCQNWSTSQTLRDPDAENGARYIQQVSPEEVVQYARYTGATAIASSYNEPLITSEWAVDIFKLARQAGLRTLFVSNGHATPEVLAYLRPYLDGYKVDLKTINAHRYQQLGGVLQHVLESIQGAFEAGLWVEVVTLLVPDFNDSTEDLWETARFLASVSPDIPWSVTAYHPDYHLDTKSTPSTTLLRAADIGQEAGLRFVYAGNLPGKVGSLEDTICPSCQKLLIHRLGFRVMQNNLDKNGCCPGCGQPVAGIWK